MKTVLKELIYPISLILVLALAGIAGAYLPIEAPKQEKKQVQVKEAETHTKEYIFRRLRWFHLPDGTPCLYFDGFKEGSIDCNWNYKNNQQEKEEK